MVNNPGSIPPNGGGPVNPSGNQNVQGSQKKDNITSGALEFSGKSHEWGGMTFTAEEWNKLMNTLEKSFSDFMNKTFKKMREKLKKDAQRMEGKDVDE